MVVVAYAWEHGFHLCVWLFNTGPTGGYGCSCGVEAGGFKGSAVGLSVWFVGLMDLRGCHCASVH